MKIIKKILIANSNLGLAFASIFLLFGIYTAINIIENIIAVFYEEDKIIITRFMEDEPSIKLLFYCFTLMSFGIMVIMYILLIIEKH